MRLDLITIIVMAVAICVPIAFLLFLAWLQNRSERSLLWWSASFLASLVGLGLYGQRDRMHDVVSVDLANAMVLFGLSLGLAGARSFNGRRTPVWMLFLAPGAWAVASYIPELQQMGPARIAAFSTVNAAVAAAIAFEYWRGRTDGLTARYMLSATFALLAAVYLSRIVLVAVMPLPDPRDYLDSHILASISMLGPIVIGISNAILVLAIAKERVEVALRYLAEIDPLTKVPNRGATLRRIAEEMEKCEERGAAVLLFDLDHFKQINDRYGHPAGDHMLRRFARIAVTHLRDGDVFGRIGGEEFLAFLTGVDRQAAMRVAERIRKAFAEVGAAENGMRISATVSIGIAMADKNVTDIDLLLVAADGALYRAKNAGRDQVHATGSAAA
ncbi:GGDEF domain-containing protein [Microbaculum marinum]|uniref:diguanylate cyclase n=1 Tax=Microbaculum marinum TaxID=1764581 RepID=A0AAW9RYC9_9HYPH